MALKIPRKCGSAVTADKTNRKHQVAGGQLVEIRRSMPQPFVLGLPPDDVLVPQAFPRLPDALVDVGRCFEHRQSAPSVLECSDHPALVCAASGGLKHKTERCPTVSSSGMLMGRNSMSEDWHTLLGRHHSGRSTGLMRTCNARFWPSSAAARALISSNRIER